MSRQDGLSQWIATVSTQMPHLSRPQARVLALWSFGMVVTQSCGLTTVAAFLALLPFSLLVLPLPAASRPLVPAWTAFSPPALELLFLSEVLLALAAFAFALSPCFICILEKAS